MGFSLSLLLVTVLVGFAYHASAKRNLNQAEAAPLKGVPGFINTFSDPTDLGGLGTLKVLTGSNLVGLGLGEVAGLEIVLEPCSLLLPHTHAQTEFQYVRTGNPTVGLIYSDPATTDGPKLYEQKAGPGGFIVIPPGLLHFTQNDGCDQVIAFAAFNKPVVDTYFYPATNALLPLETLQASLGTSGANATEMLQKQMAFGSGVLVSMGEECKARCALGAAAGAAAPSGETGVAALTGFHGRTREP